MATPPITISAPADFRSRLDTLLREQALPRDKYGHQPRLYALTCIIGDGLDYDDDIVFAAAYLHDLGVFIGHRPEKPEALIDWDHVAYTLERAPAILVDAGFPPEKISAVLAAIGTHQPQDQPRTLEATILRDADILEQIGAIGILRAAAKTGRDTRFSSFTEVAAALERSLDLLPAQIQLLPARLLAESRVALLRAFLDGVRTEAMDRLH